MERLREDYPRFSARCSSRGAGSRLAFSAVSLLCGMPRDFSTASTLAGLPAHEELRRQTVKMPDGRLETTQNSTVLLTINRITLIEMTNDWIAHPIANPVLPTHARPV